VHLASRGRREREGGGTEAVTDEREAAALRRRARGVVARGVLCAAAVTVALWFVR